MNGIMTKLSLAAGIIGLACGAVGCQDVHSENVRLAEARWSRARASVMLQLAEQQYKSGQLDKALVTIGQASALDPSFPRLSILRGQVLAELGQGQQAIAAFEAAIMLDPRSADAHYQCGVLYERWGQFDKALASYRAAMDLAPNDTSYIVASAEVLGQMDRVADGLALLDSALESQPQSVALHVTAAELWQVQGDAGKAADHFREAARLATDDVGVLRSLALALYRAGRFDEARAHLEQLLREPSPVASAGRLAKGSDDRPTDPTALPSGDVPELPGERIELLLALGDCCANTDRLDQARQCFLEVTRLAPKRSVGWEGLAKVALRGGNWEEAVASADRGLELEPGAVSGRLVRGYALLQLKRPAEAVESFRQAHRLAPKDVLMLCLMADGYRMMGDRKSARESLVRALQIAPDDPLSKKMMTQLADAEFGRKRQADPGESAPPTVTAQVRVEE